METWIALLRGINVSGQKIIKMNELSKLFEKSGFNNVKTYLQSGNVIFRYKNENHSVLEQTIQKQVFDDFGFEVPVIVLTTAKLTEIVSNNVLSKDPLKNPEFLYVTFLASPPSNFRQESIFSGKTGQEEIEITNDAVYLYCPHGYGSTRLNNNFLENKLKVTATTRNWKTTNELLKMAESVL